MSKNCKVLFRNVYNLAKFANFEYFALSARQSVTTSGEFRLTWQRFSARNTNFEKLVTQYFSWRLSLRSLLTKWSVNTLEKNTLGFPAEVSSLCYSSVFPKIGTATRRRPQTKICSNTLFYEKLVVCNEWYEFNTA